jgi:pimeloyl-ACP methyl ester carboxylesterase
MPVVDVNGHKIEYTDGGAGQSVVFVHGVLSDMRAWSPQVGPFSARYRTLAFSCRHYFPNPPVPDGVDLPAATLVDDLSALLRTLDLAPAHLVGQSSGAMVCLLLARQDPELVRSLVLAEPPALPLLGVDAPPKPSQVLRLLARDPRTALQVLRFGARGIGPAVRAFDRGDDERGLTTFVTAVVGRETVATWPEEKRQRLRDNVRAAKAVLRAGLPSFSEDDARRIQVPTLLVTGEKSSPVLHRVTDVLQRSIPGAERVDIGHASHLMFEDRPDEFNQAVFDFLERCNGGAST